jgi:hypothetical protein
MSVAAGIAIAAVPEWLALEPRAATINYRGRSGFSRSPSEMRGVARRSDVAPDKRHEGG